MSQMVVPAISLRQPWAWLLVHGHQHPNGKRIEKWCLIHATKEPGFGSAWFQRERALADLCGDRAGYPPNLHPVYANPSNPRHLEFGAIIGAVRWGRCIEDMAELPDDVSGEWYMSGFGWLTEDARPLPFVAWRGSQGFFNVPLAGLPAEYRGIVDL